MSSNLPGNNYEKIKNEINVEEHFRTFLQCSKLFSSSEGALSPKNPQHFMKGKFKQMMTFTVKS